jgi:NADPH:quinone reductase
VVAFGWGGGWAQRHAVDTTQLAVLPDSIEFIAAAALPVAAVTALRAREPTVIDFEAARVRAGGSRIEAFNVGDRFGEDLAYLVGLLAAGQLDPQVGWRGSWERASEAAELLIGRHVRGKAVLEVAR